MNYYLTGIDGMPKLLQCCEDPFPYFTRKDYADAFQRFYQQNLGTFDAIEQGYNTVIDKEQFLKNMAGALVEYAAGQMQSCKKHARAHKEMDLNLAMAVFVFPMIMEFHGNSSEPLARILNAAWKEAFPKSALQVADFEEIQKGFKRKFCYITTAVCESLGREDDCYELTLLREYRDNYLAVQPGGEEMVRTYYDVAPSVVKHINQRENAEAIYRSIWEEYISPCITMIEHGQNEECREHYLKMVQSLCRQYFYAGQI